jgi:hypothetical protein
LTTAAGRHIPSFENPNTLPLGGLDEQRDNE